MDAATRRTEMNALLERISDPAARKDISGRFEAALAAWQAATADAERGVHEKTLDALRDEATRAAGGGNANGTGTGVPVRAGGSDDGGFMTRTAFLLVAVITLVAIAFVWAYFDEPGASNFESDGSVRPLLVLTLIIAMLGFGGILIVRALFAPESFDKISERFRLAREIFLVFAGTFSTIVGFYFGSETNKDDDGGAPTVELSYAGTNVVATIAEGISPFIAIYTAAGAPAGNVLHSSDRALIFPAGATCPEDATVLVVDGRGRQATGTVACPAPGGTDTTVDNATTVPATNDTNAAANAAQ